MSKTESLLVGAFLCLTVPFVFFVAGWWGSAGLYLYHVVAIPEKGIAVCTLSWLALAPLSVIPLDHIFRSARQ